jgi:multiple sugar transport system ATP-binding protein
MFVAGFIGSPAMNFLRGQLVSNNGTVVIRGPSWELPLSARNAARASASSNGEVIVGIRHGHLQVLPESAQDGLAARVYTVEPTGDITYVHVRLGEDLLVASTPGIYHGGSDQPIRLGFDQEHLYLFDRQSEQSLHEPR